MINEGSLPAETVATPTGSTGHITHPVDTAESPIDADKHQIDPTVGSTIVKPNFDLRHLKDQLLSIPETDEKRLLALLQGLHERFWHCPTQDLQRILHGLGLPPYIIRLATKIVPNCLSCRRFALPRHKPLVKGSLTVRFNERVQCDLFFLWDETFILFIDEHIRYKVTDEMHNKTPEEFHRCLIESWCRFFGPMQFLVSDQEGAITSEMMGSACDRYSIRRILGGSTEKHTTTGLVESHIRLLKATALKLKADCDREGLSLTNSMIM